ncbi:hypothetical protein EC412_05240 [Salmonella enterica subsp. enterica serovar Redlands]|nr:hypothetical protein [Salmonella enterica subsp. enterica serovar Redlands]
MVPSVRIHWRHMAESASCPVPGPTGKTSRSHLCESAMFSIRRPVLRINTVSQVVSGVFFTLFFQFFLFHAGCFLPALITGAFLYSGDRVLGGLFYQVTSIMRLRFIISDYKDAHDLVVFPAICIAANTIERKPQSGGHHLGLSPELCYTLDTSHSSHAVITDYTVRRLMPLEYERLQGFPDHFTRIPWRRKLATDCPDGPRYKALGNSMAVPVITWLGKRLNEYLATRC